MGVRIGSILGGALNLGGNLAEQLAPLALARKVGMRKADEKKREEELEAAKRSQEEARQALIMEGLRLQNQKNQRDLTTPKKNNFTYLGREFESAEEVAAAKKVIDADRARETDPLIADERRERVEDRRRGRTADAALGHARRWARENYQMVTSGTWSDRRLNAEINRALRKFYPDLSSGERSDIIASAVSEAGSAQLATNRDTRAAESAQGGASGLLTELLKEEGVANPAAPQRRRLSKDPAGSGGPLTADSIQTRHDRILRVREDILNDKRLSPAQKQELLDSLRQKVGA